MSTIVSQQVNTKTPTFNRVFTNFVFDGKSLTGADKLLSAARNAWGGKTVTLYIAPGSTDYTSYSVKAADKKTAKDVFAIIGLIVSLMLPVLLIIKAASKDNKKIAKQLPTLSEVPEPVAKTSEKVTQKAASLQPSKKSTHATPLPADQNTTNPNDAKVDPAVDPANANQTTGPSLLNYVTLGLLGSPGSKPLHEKDFVTVTTDPAVDTVPAAAAAEGK